jgi:deazaflavin-dependent oxidoreductase (nitroreductase family)
MYLYKKSAGRMFAKVNGMPLCLLTTTGRSSRMARTVPLTYYADRDRIVLVAANEGAAENPQWYRNLLADENVTLEIDGDARAMHAVTANDDERARLWPLMVAQNPSYDELQRKSDRVFPIVICTWNV